MINVMIYTDSSKNFVGFDVSGHAEYEDIGKDIICAAVSVLTQNTINSIEQFTEDGMSYEYNPKADKLQFRFNGDVSKESDVLMNSMILGLTAIIEEYGENFLKLSYKEV